MLGRRLKEMAVWLRRVVTQPREQLDRWQQAARFAYDLARYGGRQLQHDRAPQMAAALAFRTLFALAPVLIVAMVVVKATQGREYFFDLTSQLFDAVNLDDVAITSPSPNAPPSITLADWLQNLVRQAADVNLAAVGWLGIALICYAAMGLMMTIENGFNTIYRAPYSRAWGRRVPLYWFLLTMSPVAIGIMLYVSATVATWIESVHAWHLLISLAAVLWNLVVNWLIMFAVYLLLPNTTVNVRPAAAGALVASLLLEVGKRSLGAYLNNAFAVSQLYGSLGLIPLFMFWVYLMWLVVLFGLEVSATLQALQGRHLEEMEPQQDVTGLLDPNSILSAMEVVAQRFTAGQPTSARQAAEACSLPEPAVALMFNRLVEHHILHVIDSDATRVAMALPPEKITAAQLIDVGYELADEPIGGQRSKFVTRLRQAQDELARRTTLAALADSSRTALLAILVAALLNCPWSALADDARPFGIPARVPWTTSRVVGSPDPPLPYQAVPAYADVEWQRPIYAKAEPGTDWLIVVQQGGEADAPSRLLRVHDVPDADHAVPLLDVEERLVYGIEFHPDYATNGQLFVFSNGPTGNPERLNRVSRYSVDRDSGACNPDSELVVIQWRSMGHDGGDLAFGRDGMLYVTSGDGTSDSDAWLSAQDVRNLLGGVLRIDVDHSSANAAYAIPSDNPFVHVDGARGELWAIGLRNPWRMCADSRTGQIWVGNNGQDLWETAYLLERGANYGWSVYEGSHPFYLNRQRGPAPIVPPTIEHHHTVARSLTGGVVYYGEQLPELDGAYIYGDYSTGKIWGARHDGRRLTWHEELADTTLQIAGFAVTHGGELIVVDNGGGLARIVKTPAATQTHDFPRRLSHTGLFTSVAEHVVQPGVIPYSVNAAGWNDGAQADRFLALPGDSQIEFTASRGWNFPAGAVLMQTLWLPVGTEDSASRRRVETRLLTRQQNEWVGYSYRWNDAQDDAYLVSAAGEDVELAGGPDGAAGAASGGESRQVWRFPARAECMSCHSRAANFVLGMSTLQMNREHDYGEACDNQLRTLEHIGVFRDALPEPVAAMSRLVDPFDADAEVETRARSYLHANCAACHIEAGGGNARMELGFETPRDKMNLIAARPQHEAFGIQDAMLMAPGDPQRSVLHQRLLRRGRGQMPPLVSNVVDRRAVRLFGDWIASMPDERKFVRAWRLDDLLPSLDQTASPGTTAAGETIFRNLGCNQCHRFRGEGGGAGPDLTGVAKRLTPAQLLEALIEPSRTVAPEYATTVLHTKSGKILQGRVESETDETLVLRTSASFSAPLTIPVGEIEDRSLAPTSIMPTGMLNSLERQKVLDLLSYLRAP